MKIADFFVALGFDVRGGGKELEEADRGIAGLERRSLGLLAGVTALNAAWYGLLATASSLGVGLQRFTALTGQSASELQRWQFAAARGNVEAKSIVEAIEAIQRARTAIAFGNAEAAAPWMLLGLDPRKDPFAVLDQLREKIKSLDPAIARNVLGRMGLSEDLLFLFRQPGFGLRQERGIVVSAEESRRMAGLAAAWSQFLLTLRAVGTRFAAQFAEPLAESLKALQHALVLGGKFVDWVDRGSRGATAFRYVILGLVVALTGLNIVAGLLALGPFGIFVGYLGTMATLLASLVLLVQDFWTACKGGKSAFNWNEDLILTVANVERLARAIQWVIDLWGEIKRDPIRMGKVFRDFDVEAMKYVSGYGFLRDFSKWNWPGAPASMAGANISQSFNFGPGFSGSASDVGRTTKRAVSDAMAQTPLATR